jgi:hypothetical protein
VESSAHSVQLDWSCYDQINFKEFVVERSVDGLGYSQVSLIYPGSPGSDGISSYSFTDDNVEANKVYYYRLKCVDNDDSWRYTDVKTGRAWLKRTLLSYYYADESLYVKYQGENNFSEIKVLDLTGRVVYNVPFRKDVEFNEINTGSLSKGMYLLELCGAGESETIKIITW